MKPWRRALAVDSASKATGPLRASAWCMGIAVFCFALGAFALWPKPRVSAGTDLRMVVLDASASVSRVRNGLAGDCVALLREQAQAARDAEQNFVVVTASPNASRRWGPGDPADFLRQEAQGVLLGMLDWFPSFGEDLSTDWAGAWQLLGGYLEDETVERVQAVLFTDGEAPDARSWQGLLHLAARGCEFEYGVLPKEGNADTALVSLDLPSELPPGVAGSARVRVAWRGASLGTDAVIGWKVVASDASGIVGETQGRMPATASTREGTWFSCVQSLPLPVLDAGVYRVRVQLIGAPGDRAPENQSRMGFLRVGEQLQALVLGSIAPGMDNAVTAKGLSSAGVHCKATTVEDLPLWLLEAHCVVTMGLSPSELPATELAGFVKRGGSWLALGEDSILPGWSGRSVLQGEDLGALLPLSLHEGDGPGKDVVLLVDGSGSMQGEPWAQVQAATLVLLRHVSREVGFEVDLFTGDLLDAELKLPPVAVGAEPEGIAETERALRRFLQARVPGGRTNIMRSLSSLLERRKGKGPCRVVMITDGYQNDGGWDPAALRTQMNAAQMELSIVATGENPNLSTLELLVPTDEILLAGDMSGLAELLKQRLMGDVVRRDPGMQVLPGAAGSGAPWGLPDFLSGTQAPVSSLVKTRLRKGARVLLSTKRSEPILAIGSRGRGAVAQVTSLGGADFLWNGDVSLRSLVQALAQSGRGAQGGDAQIVEHDGEYFLTGAWKVDGPVLELMPGGTGPWVQVPLVMGLGGDGLDPRDWLRLDLDSLSWAGEQPELAMLRLHLGDGRVLPISLPSGAPRELLPGGFVWPKSLPKAPVMPQAQAHGTHPAGPPVLVLGMLSLVLALWFRLQGGKGLPESADREQQRAPYQRG